MRADFEIEERGRPQKIAYWQPVSIPIGARILEHATPPADVTDNTLQAMSRRFALIIDDLHLTEAEASPVKRVLTEFVQALSPADEVAVVFVSRSDLSQNFTTDTTRIARAIRRVPEALGFGLDSGASPRHARSYSRSTTWVLDNVTANLADSRYVRSGIVLVSAGFVTAVALNNELRTVFDKARRFDVPIYTIDPRGLVTPENAVRGGIGAISDPATRSGIAGRIRGQHETLAAIALNTSGRAFLNRSDLTTAIREILIENGSFYLMGYYPAHSACDGRFHEIRVKVHQPGSRVRARRGYLARCDAAAPDETIQQTLEKTVRMGIISTDLTIRAFAAPVARSAGGMSTWAITVDLVGPWQGGTASDDPLLFQGLAIDSEGKVRASISRQFAVKRPADGTNVVRLVANTTIDLPARPLTLRVGVATALGRRIGSIQIPLDSIEPDARQLQLSGVVVGTDDIPPGVGGETLTAILPFQPTTSRIFTRTQTLRVFARAFWRSTATIESATLTFNGPASVSQALAVTSSLRENGRHEAVLYGTRTLNDLSPGDYVLTMTVRMANGQHATRSLSLSIE
jgi:VWFA-related protein